MSKPRVVVYDYGSGNLRSAEKALAHVGADVVVTSDQVEAVRCDGMLLPGVGAFGACIAQLEEVGGRAVVGDRVDREVPLLGVCVGMQVLFDRSEEDNGSARGLEALPGHVRRLRADVLPHTGWSTVDARQESVLLRGIGADERFYFVHSFGVCVGAPDHVEVAEVVGWTTHGERFAAVVERGPLMAVQFHPEKSGDVGLQLLENWVGSLS